MLELQAAVATTLRPFRRRSSTRKEDRALRHGHNVVATAACNSNLNAFSAEAGDHSQALTSGPSRATIRMIFHVSPLDGILLFPSEDELTAIITSD